MAKDFVGQELNIGDCVVFMQKNYRNLIKGAIISLSDKMCVISHSKTNVGGTTTRQFHEQVIKYKIEDN